MENLDFGRGHGRNFDHLTMVMFKFWPWSWSKIFDHMTMTPGRRPYGQKIMVALPPPPPNYYTEGTIGYGGVLQMQFIATIQYTTILP